MPGKRRKIQIAVAGGKGGAGKTTVATNMATALAESGEAVTYLDCDVEEPNGHIFLKPEIKKVVSVGIPVPVVDEQKCTSCGACAEICQYGAIVCMADRVITFPELCHGCGGCTRVCPVQAIRETPREIGVVEEGDAGRIRFVQGRLHVGHPSASPVIQKAIHRLPNQGIHIVDCPPGTSCPVIQSVSGADYVLIVTEPTPFGQNDLALTVEMLQVMGLPFGVVINRTHTGLNGVHQYCDHRGIDVFLEIPDDRRVAETYSRGQIACAAIPAYRDRFVALFKSVERRVAQ